jgi:hypothetical protein
VGNQLDEWVPTADLGDARGVWLGARIADVNAKLGRLSGGGERIEASLQPLGAVASRDHDGEMPVGGRCGPVRRWKGRLLKHDGMICTGG